MSIDQLRDVVFYSVEEKKGKQAVGDIASFVPNKHGKHCELHRHVAEKISQAILSRSGPVKQLKLYNIERYLDDDSSIKQEVIKECVKETRDLYPNKTIEEVNQEITDIVSSVHSNIKVVQSKKMAQDEIVMVLATGANEILMEGLSRTATLFEKDFLLKENISLLKEEQLSHLFQDVFCACLGDAFTEVIDIGNNKKVQDVIKTFIEKNGVITVGVAKELIKTKIFPLCKDEISNNLEREFSKLYVTNELVRNNPAILATKKQNLLDSTIKDFADWAQGEMQDKMSIMAPDIIVINRVYMFNAAIVKDKGLLNIFIDLSCKLEEFTKLNPEALNPLIDMLKNKGVNSKVSLIREALPSILTAIFCYNAAINGRMNKEAFEKMTRDEILIELSKDIKSLKDGRALSKHNKMFYKQLIEDIYLCKNFPFGVTKIEDANKNSSEVIGIFNNFFDDKIIRKESVQVLEAASSFILTRKIEKTIESQNIPTDQECSMMLMFALGDKAEEFICKNYGPVEQQLLEKQSGSSKILKVDQVFKTVLTTTALSTIARLMHKRKFRVETAERNTTLKLRDAFNYACTLQDALPLTRENILQKIQEHLLYPLTYSKMLNMLEGEEDFVLDSVRNKIQAALKDKGLDADSKACLESVMSSFRGDYDAQTLINPFYEFLFPDLNERINRDKQARSKVVISAYTRSGTPILKIKSFNMVKGPLLNLIQEEFIKEFQSFSKDYIISKPKAFLALQQFFHDIGGRKEVGREDFETGEELLHKLSKDSVNVMPTYIVSVMLMVWARNQGLRALEEKRALKLKEILLEAFSSDKNIEEALVEFSTLAFTALNRGVFLVANKLEGYDSIEEAQILESKCVYISEHLDRKSLQEESFKDCVKSLFTFLKKAIDKEKESKTIVSNKKATPEQQGAKRKEVKEQILVDKVKIEEPASEGSDKHLSKAERNRLHRIEMQKRRKEEAEKKKLELEAQRSFTQDLRSEIQEEPKPLMVEEPIVENKRAEEVEEVIITDSSEKSDSLELYSLDSSKSIDEDEVLASKTLDEVLYEAQAEAIDELDAEFDGLSDRERALLLRFSSKMKSSALEKAYKKGAIDNENQRKEQRSIAAWGTKYKFQDIEDEEGAAAPVNMEYTIIQSKAFVKWLEKRNPRIQEDIERRFTKAVIEGDLGDVRALNGGDLGAYEFKFRDSCLTRIYYVPKGKNIYILCGGDKSDQGKTIVERLPGLVAELKKAIEI